MPTKINSHTNNSKAVIEKMKQIYANDQQDELDGLTVESGAFWFNLRASNTEPVIRLNIEAESQDLLDEELSKIKHVVDSTL